MEIRVPLTVLFGLVSAAGLLSIIFNDWCNSHRSVWLCTAVTALLTGFVAIIEKTANGIDETPAMIIPLSFGVALLLLWRVGRKFRKGTQIQRVA